MLQFTELLTPQQRVIGTDSKMKPNSDVVESDNRKESDVISSCREILSPTKLAFSVPQQSDPISPTSAGWSIHYLLEMKVPNLRLIPALCSSPRHDGFPDTLNLRHTMPPKIQAFRYSNIKR